MSCQSAPGWGLSCTMPPSVGYARHQTARNLAFSQLMQWQPPYFFYDRVTLLSPKKN
ncbi:unnamed protein product [Staurois parvus]|uniref:Uncharacterized protein n=1 Tax=Staurois parvus TaxID=386267 RepID=A0ABN9EUQ6_9NEOB|nr:unnamed protein product [Staurois parvus]